MLGFLVAGVFSIQSSVHETIRDDASLSGTKTANNSDNTICNRNGILQTNGLCRCDAAWRGPHCSELALLPANGKTLGTIYPGRNSTTTSSWGGTVTLGVDGL